MNSALSAVVGEDDAPSGGAVSLAVSNLIFSNCHMDPLLGYWYHFCIMFDVTSLTLIDAGS